MSKGMIFDSRHGQDLNENKGPRISMDMTSEVSCEKCGSTFFDISYQIRKAPALVTGAGQDAFMRLPVFTCKKCGHINSEFELNLNK